MPDGEAIERGRDSVQRTVEEERISTELEEFAIGSEGLKDPRPLPGHSHRGKSKEPAVIPLETEVCDLFVFSVFGAIGGDLSLLSAWT